MTEEVEFGLRPAGAIGACAPEGSGKFVEFGSVNAEGGSLMDSELGNFEFRLSSIFILFYVLP
jgi:hypothetical protein